MIDHKDNFFIINTTEASDVIGHLSLSAELLVGAYNYWATLKEASSGDHIAFTTLTPEGLAPFKSECIMISLADFGKPLVRFAGPDVQKILGAELNPGAMLFGTGDNLIEGAIMQALEMLHDHKSPLTFKAVTDSGMGIDGLMLPFGRTEAELDLVLLLLHPALSLSADTQPSALDDILQNCREVAERVVHVDARTRDTLYEALAGALGLYEECQIHPGDYERLLGTVGLKAQQRAPFTPILKLVFGKEYDKTRLTEYAAALSYGWRSGESASSLSGFLNQFPGGIKGCVKAERIERRKARGNFTADRFAAAEEKLRTAQAVALNTLKTEEEFSLVLVRRAPGGAIEPVTFYDASNAVMETAIKHTASKLSRNNMEKQE